MIRLAVMVPPAITVPCEKRRRPFCLWKRVLRFTTLVALGFMGLLAGCQSRLIYHPSPYLNGEPAAFVARGGQRVDFTTEEGNQSAWLIPPRDGKRVDHLWIVCSGNFARALDMEPFCRSLPFEGDAYLLVDYPGYGECQGSPHPSRIRDSLRALIPLAAKRLDLETAEIAERTCVFGHSLGCAAGLIAAEEFGLRRAVLLAPFTSTMEMAGVMLRQPLGFLVWHRFDNREGLAAMQKHSGRAWIFHGTADNIVPPAMSITLAQEFAGTVTRQEISGAGHNDLFRSGTSLIIAAMGTARRE